jgi:hypothetical protein
VSKGEIFALSRQEGGRGGSRRAGREAGTARRQKERGEARVVANSGRGVRSYWCRRRGVAGRVALRSQAAGCRRAWDGVEGSVPTGLGDPRRREGIGMAMKTARRGWWDGPGGWQRLRCAGGVWGDEAGTRVLARALCASGARVGSHSRHGLHAAAHGCNGGSVTLMVFVFIWSSSQGALAWHAGTGDEGPASPPACPS